MVNVVSWSSGDFQQGGCLSKPTSSIYRTPQHLWTSDRRQKPASVKIDHLDFGNGALVVSRSQTTSASRLSIRDYKCLLEVIWYIDRQISVTASTVLPWLLIGVNIWFREVRQWSLWCMPSNKDAVYSFLVELCIFYEEAIVGGN